MMAHWSIPDPAAATGTDVEIALAFKDVYRMLSRRIELFLALPLGKIDAMTTQARLETIGQLQTTLQAS